MCRRHDRGFFLQRQRIGGIVRNTILYFREGAAAAPCINNACGTFTACDRISESFGWECLERSVRVRPRPSGKATTAAELLPRVSQSARASVLGADRCRPPQ